MISLTDYKELERAKFVYNGAGRIALSVSDTTGAGVVKVDEPNSSTTYVGWAAPGTATSAASWRIQKIAVSGTVTTITWADGDQSFDNIWDNRASLTYS